MPRHPQVTVIVTGDPKELVEHCASMARAGVAFSFKMWEIRAKFDTLAGAQTFANNLRVNSGLHTHIKP